MGSRSLHSGRRRRNTSTNEFASPWSPHEGWSFNPKNISVFSPSHARRSTDSSDFDITAARRKFGVGHISTIQKMTIVLLITSIFLGFGIFYIVLS